MNNDFRFPRERLISVWILSATLTVALGALLLRVGADLPGPGAPYGILSLEFAWSDAGLARILGGWNPAQTAAAVLSTRMDYAFLLSYGSALASGALLFGGRRAAAFAACAAAAAAADAVENAIALRALSHGRAGAWTAVMSSAAALKFALAGACLAYVCVRVWRRNR